VAARGETLVVPRLTKLVLYGLVLSGLVLGTAAWVRPDRSVTLRVDGQSRTVHTRATTVAGVLSAAGITVGPHDLVAPDASATIGNGAEVVLRRGHELRLVVNGKLVDVWVNAASVDEALTQLGYGDHDYVSVSRSSRLSNGVTSMTVASPKHIRVRVDGRSLTALTAGPTVGQALVDAGVFLTRGDRVRPAASAAITEGMTVTIERVSYKARTRTVSVPYSVVKRADDTAYAGTQTVVTAGRSGSATVTYQLLYLDGKLVSQVVQWSEPVVAPVTEILAVGTKPVPAFVSAYAVGSPRAIAAAMVAQHGWGADQFDCLNSLWTKESNWRVNAANSSGAYGIPQALPGSKMSTVANDWQTNPATQITWGLGYIVRTYATPCAAWAHSEADNWY